MNFKIITDATVEPVTLAELRQQCRLVAFGGSHPDDVELASLGVAAREWCEQYTGRSFAQKTLELALDDFPCADIELPTPVIDNIVSVKYVDTAGFEQTVSSTNYALDDYSTPNWCLLGVNKSWPQTLETANNVKVRVQTKASAAPAPVKKAILLMVGNYYENRQEDVLGNTRISFNSLPMGVYTLLQPYRINLGV
jgi:uncharacterized phiE125 gp8 family phage protein